MSYLAGETMLVQVWSRVLKQIVYLFTRLL